MTWTRLAGTGVYAPETILRNTGQLRKQSIRGSEPTKILPNTGLKGSPSKAAFQIPRGSAVDDGIDLSFSRPHCGSGR